MRIVFLPAGELDIAVGMGCGDACSRLPVRSRLQWDLDAPGDLQGDAYRRVRDEIGVRVRGLLAETGPQ